MDEVSPSFSEAFTSSRVARAAGASPNIRLRLRLRFPPSPDNSEVGRKIEGDRQGQRKIPRSPALWWRDHAKSSPTPAPRNERIRFPIINCRMTRPRPAPIASRMAISLRREVPRASSRLAIFTQAISNTRPAITITTAETPRNILPSSPGRTPAVASAMGCFPFFPAAWRRRSLITFTSACASWRDTPCFQPAENPKALLIGL